MDQITIKGAKTHNLKNIDVVIPRDRLTVITGLSGSGKSSLAFDTLYAEGQRRYVDSLSTYARQFLDIAEKPDVESIDGLSPAISIDQKTASHNPRSTVGTVTEIYDYLRLLYARIGEPHCPNCGRKITRQSVDQMIDHIATYPQGKKIMLLAPIIRDKKGEHVQVLEKIRKDGFVRYRVDGQVYTATEELTLDANKKHTIEIVVDRLVVKDFARKFEETSNQQIEVANPDRTRLADSLELSLKHGNGIVIIYDPDANTEELFSELFSCPHCNINIPEIEPRSFSFNSPHGACPECHGLGTKLEISAELVVPNPELSINEGAILPWATSSTQLSWFSKILEAVASKHKFSLDIPWSKLSQSERDLILFGTKDQSYTIDIDGSAFSGTYQTRFEGVIANLERRYRETDSDYAMKKIERFMRLSSCPSCGGKRLKKEMLAVTIMQKSIIDATELSVADFLDFFNRIVLTESQKIIAIPILKQIKERSQFLIDVGLNYLTLHRSAATLSGGEAQRIRLATQIGSKLTGVLYVLDEPSIGLHQRDNDRLIQTLKHLRDIGNTVIVVEHDEDTINTADHVIDIGPGAGRHGGYVIATGTPDQIKKNVKSLTGKYLAGTERIDIPEKRRSGNGLFLQVKEAAEHNLKEVTVSFPLGTFISVTGVSGSGKSTLVNNILVEVLAARLNHAQTSPGKHKDVEGIEYLDKIIDIDQSPIGRTPRSNPATYSNVFTDIRELFALTQEARLRGYKGGRFSFNVKGGRCETCQGDGVKKIEMHFLPDVYVNCEVCKGKRYNTETLQITYRGKNIAEVLDMTVDEAYEFFKAVPNVENKLHTIREVGLGYIKLGQSATTLSGGEAQRLKLSTELARKATGKTLYVLDEPTTGLHFDDVKRLIHVLQRLVDKGNTVLVIEHNLDVIKSVDYIVDLGPEGGDGGGQVIAQGTPEEVAKQKKSYTGQWLKKMLEK